MPLIGSELYYKDFDEMTEKEKEEISATYGSSVFSSGAWSMAKFELAYREQLAREEEEQRLYDERYDTWDDPEPEVESYNSSIEFPFNWDDENLLYGDSSILSEGSKSYVPFEYESSSSSDSDSIDPDYLKKHGYDFNKKRRLGDKITLLQLAVYWVIVPRIPFLMTQFFLFFNMRRMLMSSAFLRDSLFLYYYHHFCTLLFIALICLYAYSRAGQYLDRKQTVDDHSV